MSPCRGKIKEGALSNKVGLFPTKKAVAIKIAQNLFTSQESREVSNASKAVLSNTPSVHPNCFETVKIGQERMQKGIIHNADGLFMTMRESSNSNTISKVKGPLA